MSSARRRRDLSGNTPSPYAVGIARWWRRAPIAAMLTLACGRVAFTASAPSRVPEIDVTATASATGTPAPAEPSSGRVASGGPSGASGANVEATPRLPSDTRSGGTGCPVAAGEGSYERWAPPTALRPLERALLQGVRRWRYRRGGHLHYDWRLGRAAEAMLGWAREHAGEPFPLEALRTAAWTQGWTDGELAGVAIDGPRGDFAATLQRQLATTFDHDAELDHVGVAVSTGASDDEIASARCTAVVALSRRLMHLAPVARRVAPNGVVALSGRLDDSGAGEVTVVAKRPDDSLLRLRAPREGRRLTVHLPAGPQQGTLLLQLLLERGRGPEIAASFPIQVGGDAAATEQMPRSIDTPAEHHGSLLALLYGLRAAHNLPLPAPVPTLMRVARSHAEDMVKHRFFAHVSRRTGTVVDRLERAHQPFVHVVENIAEGPDADQVFAQWLQSPGHRLNLLDPHVDAVGIAAIRGRAGAATVAVLVMARLSPRSPP